MAFRLIRRQEKFYHDFQAPADQLLGGARLLEEMLAPESPLGEKPTRSSEIKKVGAGVYWLLRLARAR